MCSCADQPDAALTVYFLLHVPLCCPAYKRLIKLFSVVEEKLMVQPELPFGLSQDMGLPSIDVRWLQV